VVIDCSKQKEELKRSPVDIRIEFETNVVIPNKTTAYCLILHDRIAKYEGSFLYSRTRHERKILEQREKFIFEYRLFAFEYKYYIVSITFLIHYKNIHLVCPQNAIQQPL
jgi:hypothetical protein